jgi:hypothetical protein
MVDGGKGIPKNPNVGPYFQTPKGIFLNGIAPRIGASAVSVYVALCLHANEKNGNVFSVSDRTLAADTGIAERTIRDVRTRLTCAGLISFDRDHRGQSYTYKLVPVKLVRIPVKERPRPPKKRRALHAEKQPLADAQRFSEVQQELPYHTGNACRTPPADFAGVSGKVC